MPATFRIWGKIKSMPYILEHLSSLRQEITDLRNMNARFTGKGADSQIDQSAVEMRANRLVEIKKEVRLCLRLMETEAAASASLRLRNSSDEVLSKIIC